MAASSGRRRGLVTVVSALLLLTLTVWFAIGFVADPDAPDDDAGPTYDRSSIDLPKDKRPVPEIPLGQADPDAPNVLYVMTDDMRHDEMQFMPFTREFFAQRGVVFENSFSPFPWCCPARASFVSGQLSQNHNVFKSSNDYAFGMFDDSRSIATALREAGYSNAFVGRYLNGYGTQTSYVTGGASARYVPPGWDQWRAMPTLKLPDKDPLAGGPFRYFDSTMNINGRLEGRPGRYQTTMLGQESREVLDLYDQTDRPWFLYLAPAAPHWGLPFCESDDPCDVTTAEGSQIRYNSPARPKRVRGMFDDVVPHAPGLPADGSDPESDQSDQPAWLQSSIRTPSQRDAYDEIARQRGEALYVLDEQIRRTVEQLDRDDELDDTVIIFTSDNGYFLGEHRLPPSKIKPQEASLRVPFMIAGPGIPQGQVRFDPVTTVDATATIADYTGADDSVPYPLDGRSLRTVLEQGDQGWDELVLYSGHIRGMTDRSAAVAGIFTDERDGVGIRTPRWSFHVFRDGSEVLYDLDEDPDELTNRAFDPELATVRSALLDLVVAYKECYGDQCREDLADRFTRDPSQNARLTESQLRRTRSFTEGGAWAEVDWSPGLRTRAGIEGNPVGPIPDGIELPVDVELPDLP